SPGTKLIHSDKEGYIDFGPKHLLGKHINDVANWGNYDTHVENMAGTPTEVSEAIANRNTFAHNATKESEAAEKKSAGAGRAMQDAADRMVRDRPRKI